MAEANLELLMAMVQRVLDDTAALKVDNGEIKRRLNDLNLSVAGLRRDNALTFETVAS